jgi:hypothetical protein
VLSAALSFVGAFEKESDNVTWKQIKKAVEESDLEEDEEVSLIQCENGDGDGTFHKVRLGRAVKLAENVSEDAAKSSGCAI